MSSAHAGATLMVVDVLDQGPMGTATAACYCERMPSRLYVGGISFSTSNDALRELFAQAGGVESAALVTDVTTGQSRGFGYVKMVSAEAARSAIRQLHRKEFDGRKLTVHLTIPERSR